MTPEEKAVIDAAMEAADLFRQGDTPEHPEVRRLVRVVDSLIYSCPDCNRGGHTCPGDGNGIAHGETDCGRHNEDLGDLEPTWNLATFGDLFPGDRARIGQEETTVTRVSRGQWHAKDRQWIGDDGKVRDHMTPWEHEELRIDFTVNPGMRVYPPDVECEILCDAERAALLLLQRSFPDSTGIAQ